jgi:polyphosphate kinase
VASVRAAPQTELRLLNPELSWLDYDERVLDLIADETLPLLERVKFGAIFSSMLDEFFMVRVAGLMGQAASGISVVSADGRTAQDTLAEVRERVLALMSRLSKVWARDLKPALAEQGIVIAAVEDLTSKELAHLTTRFEREIYPVLTPLAVGPGQPFPYISGLSLSLGVFVRDPDSGEERFARVKVPEGMPRFVHVGRRSVFVPLENVIAHYLPDLFPQMEIAERAVFRVTRDADFEVSDEADDLLEAVEYEVRRRRFGDAVRLEVSSSTSARMIERLQDGLGIEDDQVYHLSGPLDLADLWQLSELDRPDLKDAPWVPVTAPRLAHVATDDDLFAELRRGTILVHHPYESFTTSFETFVRRAARDSEVIALKATVYRTSDESPLVPALMEAAENGKQSVCLVELKARFDEHRNIRWSRSLERAGVHVVYGFAQRKVHLKAILVVRREGDSLRRYAHVGTGNYHAINARTYEDFGLFTADQEIAGDLADLFNHVTGFGKPQRFKKLLVSPFNMREALIADIKRVADAAAEGKSARIRMKMNRLTDERIIEELYTASEAGATIELIVREVCTLRPGVKGLSSNIRVRSILGRFLEHSRLVHLEWGDDASYYLGSADLMARNLDNRLEILVPIEDQRSRQRLNAIFDVLLEDNLQAWELLHDGTWKRVRPKKSESKRGTQAVLMARQAARPKRRPPARRR